MNKLNRPIEFRVWDKLDKVFWIATNGIYFRRQKTIAKELGISISAFIQRPEQFTIQQFTGLTDKNGKKIFEGDIVKYIPVVKKHFKESIGLIQWNEMTFETTGAPMKYAGFTFEETNDSMIGYFHYEVIGNIFENPELLKQ